MTRMPQHDEHGRVCAGPCGQYKTWDQFHRHGKGFHGHYGRCTACKAIDDATDNRAERVRIQTALAGVILDLVAQDATVPGVPITADLLRAKERGPEVDLARAIAYYVIQAHLRVGDVQTGLLLCDPQGRPRDRTTVLHGLKNLRRRLEREPELAARLAALDAACTAAPWSPHLALPLTLRRRAQAAVPPALRPADAAQALLSRPLQTPIQEEQEPPPPPAIPTDPVALYWHLQAHRRRPGAPLYAVG